jgi:hypothetical protein
MKQNENESTTDFARRLRDKAASCAFGAKSAEDILAVREHMSTLLFMMGIRNRKAAGELVMKKINDIERRSGIYSTTRKLTSVDSDWIQSAPTSSRNGESYAK